MPAATVALLALLMSVTHSDFHVLGADVLQLGASLSPSSPPLVSNNSAFTLSFRPFSATSSNSSLYLAISFSAAPLDHPAWVANPNNPVSPSASLNLSRTTLSLTLNDPSFAQPFQISNSSSSTAVRAQLLDSGNLVLLNSSSSVVWQSFDYPTDTLLPSQRFSSASQLASQSSSDSFAPGRYLMNFDHSGSLLLTDSQYVSNTFYTPDYWSWPNAAAQSPASFLQLDHNGTFSFYSSPDVVNSSFISADYGVIIATRRLTLDMDGNLRMYTWNPAVSQWIRVWLAFDNVCTRAVNGDIYARGWLKKRVLKRLRSQHFRRSLLKISDPNESMTTVSRVSSTTWSPDSLPSPSNQTSSNAYNISSEALIFSKMVVISLTVVIGVVVFSFGLVTICLIRRAANNLSYAQSRLANLNNIVSGSPSVFSYLVLEAATNNFSEKLGSGGFSTVYKGQLVDQKVVAVKRLDGIAYRDMQFHAEIATLGKIHHMNLLRLYGFCADGDHRLLVYEYMENGSLDGTLFHRSSDHPTLDWNTRFQICLGIARGITYLHDECLDRILHCDIKPQNILLDENNCAKVADFGLAYLLSRDDTVQMTTIRGTRGYLAPEWVLQLPITAKADVYSFGMVILEVVSGRQNYLYSESAMKETNEKWCFPAWAYAKKVEEVVDERMRGEVDYEQAEVVLKVAFLCIQADMNARPSMGKVVQMLEGRMTIPEVPPPSLFLAGMSNTQHPNPLAVYSSSSSTPSSLPMNLSLNNHPSSSCGKQRLCASIE